jgi:hypothetical protein
VTATPSALTERTLDRLVAFLLVALYLSGWVEMGAGRSVWLLAWCEQGTEAQHQAEELVLSTAPLSPDKNHDRPSAITKAATSALPDLTGPL